MRAVKTLIRKVGPTRSNVLITGRVGHGQGAGRPGPPRRGVGARRAVPGRQLRGDPERAAGEPALRPRPGRLHRGRPRPRRALRRGGAGDGLPRRDRRAAAGDPGQAPPRHRAEGGAARRRDAARRDRARVLAATNKDLAAEVAAGPVPGRPLLPAQRRGDRPAPAPRPPRGHPRADPRPARPARRIAWGGRRSSVDNATIRRLSAADWKGNVRELDNALERAMILAEGPVLTWSDFPPELVGPPGDDGRRTARLGRPPRGARPLRAGPRPPRPRPVRGRQARGRPAARPGALVALSEARRVGCRGVGPSLSRRVGSVRVVPGSNRCVAHGAGAGNGG